MPSRYLEAVAQSSRRRGRRSRHPLPGPAALRRCPHPHLAARHPRNGATGGSGRRTSSTRLRRGVARRSTSSAAGPPSPRLFCRGLRPGPPTDRRRLAGGEAGRSRRSSSGSTPEARQVRPVGRRRVSARISGAPVPWASSRSSPAATTSSTAGSTSSATPTCPNGSGCTCSTTATTKPSPPGSSRPHTSSARLGRFAHVDLACQGGAHPPAGATPISSRTGIATWPACYGSVLPRVQEDLVLTLEDDVEPPLDAARRLGAVYRRAGRPAHRGGRRRLHHAPRPRLRLRGARRRRLGDAISWPDLPAHGLRRRRPARRVHDVGELGAQGAAGQLLVGPGIGLGRLPEPGAAAQGLPRCCSTGTSAASTTFTARCGAPAGAVSRRRQLRSREPGSLTPPPIRARPVRPLTRPSVPALRTLPIPPLRARSVRAPRRCSVRGVCAPAASTLRRHNSAGCGSDIHRSRRPDVAPVSADAGEVRGVVANERRGSTLHRLSTAVQRWWSRRHDARQGGLENRSEAALRRSSGRPGLVEGQREQRSNSMRANRQPSGVRRYWSR